MSGICDIRSIYSATAGEAKAGANGLSSAEAVRIVFGRLGLNAAQAAERHGISRNQQAILNSPRPELNVWRPNEAKAMWASSLQSLDAHNTTYLNPEFHVNWTSKPTRFDILSEFGIFTPAAPPALLTAGGRGRGVRMLGGYQNTLPVPPRSSFARSIMPWEMDGTVPRDGTAPENGSGRKKVR